MEGTDTIICSAGVSDLGQRQVEFITVISSDNLGTSPSVSELLFHIYQLIIVFSMVPLRMEKIILIMASKLHHGI